MSQQHANESSAELSAAPTAVPEASAEPSGSAQTSDIQPLASEVWCGPLGALQQGGLAAPRIGIAGISIESSTFSPHVSGWEAFTLRRGDDLRAYYPFFEGDDAELWNAAQWVPLMHGRSLPGGAVDREVYESMRDEITERIRAEVAANGELDGLFFDIHGAMSVIGMEDAEGDLATHVRAALGGNTLVSASMDLHGNVSPTLAENVDLLTCYRMAPHEDVWNTKERAVFNLLTRLRSEHGSDPIQRRPYQAWVQVPVLLPGEKTSTRLEPAKSLYEQLPGIAASEGVLDASIWIGYAWADEPRCQVAIVVSGDVPDVLGAKTKALAQDFWAARDGFQFVAPVGTLAECLDLALNREPGAPTPYVISDSGDNPTAGGAGDVSWTLGELLSDDRLTSSDLTVIHASIFDPAAVAAVREAGVGGQIDVEVGGRVDGESRGPVRITGEVFSLTEGDPTAGGIAVIRQGAVHAIITERRKPYHHVHDFTDLGLDPHAADIVLVKIGYLEPELYDMAADWRMALTPGGVDQDLLRLGHHRIERPMFPFDPDMADPQFVPVIRRRGFEDRVFEG
ncbi:M81 family metallopeptidase [Timonella senegalensis]|uniref:M81 family metallopeptidase n=1 Tax=Timonella senegalensis TaxID=1465825 RepID=UPI0028A8B068|nr:M81 family metallopeptidase [Timonella senegalensis]